MQSTMIPRSCLKRLHPRGTDQLQRNAYRGFTSGSVRFSGHNRWSTIRHDKAKNDKLKSKERQLVSKEISSATQSTPSES